MENDPQHTSVMPRDFTFHLLEKITDKFSKDRIIGYGGYGVVYKGVLDNGEEIAVKKLHNKHLGHDDDKQFTNECTNLMRLQHQNIVRLVGYCYEIAHKLVEFNGQYVYAGVEERALCFEYLQGGTLEKLLSDESCGLGWHTRYKIIRGVCEGLHYLHNGSKDPIYHLDLKPANVMLDKNMVPKIGDFGLSRLFDSTQTCTTKGIIGTPGYMPPEYINRNKITQKFDVFSLGVIIMQVMAGRGGYSKFGDMSHQEFVDLVHGNWRKRLQFKMSSRISHEIKACIEIALRCVEPDRVKRPTIAEIVDELNKIDDVKRSLADEDNLHSMQARLYMNSGAADAEGALTVNHGDNGKEKERMTLEDKILGDDPSDTEYPFDTDTEGALTVDHWDEGIEQEHMTLEDKILEDDPSDIEYPFDTDGEGALTVDHRDDDKQQEHMTQDDPSDIEYPGPQTGGTLEMLRSMWATIKPTSKTKSGFLKEHNGLFWCHDHARCQDGDFSVAVVQANNFMEDECLVESGLPFGTVAGIFDGHGGPEAACFIRDHLLPNLQETFSRPQGVTADAIREAFLATEQGFITLVSSQWCLKPKLAAVGSCCLVGVVHQRTLFIANLGDSRAVLGKVLRDTGEVLAVQLSAEHNVNYEEARKELTAEHPDDPDIVVLKHNTWRVKGLIQVSRSIGDAYLKDPRYNMEPLQPKFRLSTPFSKPLLSASPSIVSHSLQPGDHFVIFASDGLWENLTNQEAVDIVQKYQRAGGSARRLIKAALLKAAAKREMKYSHLMKIDRGIRRHFHDDITVIVLFFNHALEPLSIRCPLGNGNSGP